MHTWKKRMGVAVGHTLEYYDLAVYSALSVYISQIFFPQYAFGKYAYLYVWVTIALRYLIRPLGGFIIGSYADKYGRRATLIVTSFIMGLATLVMASLPDYNTIGIWAPCLFILMQLIQAFSFGGEYPTTIAFLMENAHKKEYARIGTILGGTPFISVIFSLFIVFLVQLNLTETEMLDFGWRIPLLIGLFNITFSYYFKVQLLESRDFKASQKTSIQPWAVLRIFLIVGPLFVIFYGNSVSSKMLIEQVTSDPELRAYLPILFNFIYVIAICVIGFLIDKYSDCYTVLKKNYLCMIIFAIPVYALQSVGSVSSLIVSQVFITLFTSITLCASNPICFLQTEMKNRTTSLALGINLGAAFFGGTTPLMIQYLSLKGLVYVGALMAFVPILFFIAMCIQKEKFSALHALKN
tara:strand:+ start:1022 stop:2251 length:1230 start_codon:yes stop_codon:yes gene_type:complete